MVQMRMTPAQQGECFTLLLYVRKCRILQQMTDVSNDALKINGASEEQII